MCFTIWFLERNQLRFHPMSKNLWKSTGRWQLSRRKRDQKPCKNFITKRRKKMAGKSEKWCKGSALQKPWKPRCSIPRKRNVPSTSSKQTKLSKRISCQFWKWFMIGRTRTQISKSKTLKYFSIKTPPKFQKCSILYGSPCLSSKTSTSTQNIIPTNLRNKKQRWHKS